MNLLPRLARLFFPVTLFFTLTLFLVAVPIYAASLQVTKISALDLGGKTYSELWYTGTKPVISGTAGSNTDVKVAFGSQSYTERSDASGNWAVYFPQDKGDYTLAITAGSEKVSLILHLGQDMPATLGTTAQTSSSTAAVPSTGFNQVAALLFSAGVIMLASYFYILDGDNSKKIFEKKFYNK